MRNFADQFRQIIAPKQPVMEIAKIIAIDVAKGKTRIAIGPKISDIPNAPSHKLGKSIVVHGPVVVSDVPGAGRIIYL